MVGVNDDPLWQSTVDHSRSESMRILREIRSGTVNLHDLEMLHNFLQFSLALMQMEGSKKWARAKMNAEIMELTRREK